MSIEATPQPPYPLHPSVVDRLDPEYVDFYNKYIINNQQVHYQSVEQSRIGGLPFGAGPLQEVGSTKDYTISRVESKGPDVSVRVFTPNGEPQGGRWPVVIYYHGGGWVLGNINTENVVCSNICARAEAVVVSVDYRLAPEDVFPAAVEDSWEAVRWLKGDGARLLNAHMSRCVVAGSSAGGNLAAVMCQRAASLGKSLFQGQILIVPVTDNTATTATNKAWKELEHTAALPAEKMLWYRAHYLPDEAEHANPEASPLLWKGDWSTLPRASIIIGELDVLSEEGRLFSERLQSAGVQSELHVMRGMPHPFLAMDGVLEKGRVAISLMCESVVQMTSL